MQTCLRVVLFGAGASAGARSEPRPPLGHELLKYVADYLEKIGAPIEWDLSKLKGRIVTEPSLSFEHLANHLSSCRKRDLLIQLNFLMACAMTLSFPLFFVFHRAGFMLPGFSHIEPDATPPETASVTGSPASSVVVFGCRTPQYIRNSPPSSLRVWHSAAHAPARV